MNLRFSAVLFDCDGVLVDSETTTNGVLRAMLAELGWQLTERECVELFVGRALADEWPVILQHTGFRIDDGWIGAFRARRNTALETSLQPIPGAAEAVAFVREQLGPDGLACATGADRYKVEMQLRITGLAASFGPHVFSGMECAASKPAPDVYLAAAGALRVDPATAAVVEDTVAGVTAGVAAGATVFGFSAGGPTSTAPDLLRAAGASTVFTDMRELPALLDV